jgi:hypothetical protein
MEMTGKKEKPQIRQAGSAEAFVGSAATGRELYYNRQFSEKMQLNLNGSRTVSCELWRQKSGKSSRIFPGFSNFPGFLLRPACPNPRPT